MTLPLFAQGRYGVERAVERRDEGVKRAEETAGDAFARDAYAALQSYVDSNGGYFCDDFHRATEHRFFRKAFGAVVNRAVREGLMVRTSEARPSAASNMAPKFVYRAVVP